jgi:hypothetical protein
MAKRGGFDFEELERVKTMKKAGVLAHNDDGLD